MIKNRYGIPALLAVLLTLASCIKEPLDAPQTGSEQLPENTIAIKLVGTQGAALRTAAQAQAQAHIPTTRAVAPENGSAAENLISELIVLAFPYTANGSGVLQTVQQISLDPLPSDQTQWAQDSILLVGGLKELASPKNLYVVANWTKVSPSFSAADFVVGTTTEAELKEKVMQAAGRIATPSAAAPLLMQGYLSNYNFVANQLRAEVGLARAVAKIRLNISIDDVFQAAHPDVTDWGKTFVTGGATSGGVHTRAVNLADRTFVAGRSPSAAPADRVLIHPGYAAAAIPQTTPYTWIDSTYVFENPVRGKTAAAIDAATYVILHLPYTRNGELQTNNYYKIYINNAANTTDPYLVERNYIYDIGVTIIGFGMSEELAIPDPAELEIEVTPWAAISWITKLEDAKDEVSTPIFIPPWDPMYDGGSSLGDGGGSSSDPDDDQDGGTIPGNGVIDPWNPNGNNGGVKL